MFKITSNLCLIQERFFYNYLIWNFFEFICQVRIYNTKENFCLLIEFIKIKEWLIHNILPRSLAEFNNNGLVNVWGALTEKGQLDLNLAIFCIFLIYVVCVTQLGWYLQNNTVSSCVYHVTNQKVGYHSILADASKEGKDIRKSILISDKSPSNEMEAAPSASVLCALLLA